MAKTTVMDWERGLLFTDGRYAGTLPPGRHRHRIFRDTVETVDMRRRNTVVSGQELLTADNVTLRITVLVTWWVADPLAFHTASEDPGQALHLAAQLAIRDAVAGSTLDGVLTERGRLTAGLGEATAAGVEGLGIEVLSAAVRDLILPGELRRAVTETMLAKEAGRAELERARAEAAALRALANAARVLEEHPALLKLRTLRAAESPGTTVVLTHDPQHLP
nr:slipin family protein [Micromonospora sp. DSM 115978]